MKPALIAGTQLTTQQRSTRRSLTPRRVPVREVESTQHRASASRERAECGACGHTVIASAVPEPSSGVIGQWRRRDARFRHWYRRMVEQIAPEHGGRNALAFRAMYCPTCDNVFVALTIKSSSSKGRAVAEGFIVAKAHMVDRFLRDHPEAKEAAESC